MDIKPVRHYATPHLPTHDIVEDHPDLLRLLPKRWQSNSAVIAALTACIAMSSCAASAAGKAAPKNTSRIAPVFVHGAGIGAFGCEVVNPPTFLSEDEARQVIVEEAKRAGIIFTTDGKTLPKIEMPATPREWGDKQPKRQTHSIPIALDGLDKKHNIAFEFVSRDDLVDWQGDPGKHPASTVIEYNVAGTAKDLRAGLTKAKPVGTYAVFYDPVAMQKMDYSPGTDFDTARVKASALAIDEARSELRAQVKDFIKWLKGQGVI